MNTLIAALVLALPQVETPNGVPLQPGPAGETGRYQLTPAVRADRGRELVARGEAVTDEAIARAQVIWLIDQERSVGIEPNAFNVALAWNCGFDRVRLSQAPVSSYRFAVKVRRLISK